MLRDVFYFGEKPNVHPRERHAIDVDDARQLATTDHFWIISKFAKLISFHKYKGVLNSQILAVITIIGWIFTIEPDESKAL